jgi:hypothetical protein
MQFRRLNLEWHTYGENNQHAWDELSTTERRVNLKKQMTGENNREAKITEADVREIREYHRTVHTNYKKIFAEKFGLAEGSIKNIALGRCWKHVK